jgi:hypothetical protein
MSRDVNHALDAIDDALADHGVSDDAMRWTAELQPEPEPPPSVWRLLWHAQPQNTLRQELPR